MEHIRLDNFIPKFLNQYLRYAGKLLNKQTYQGIIEYNNLISLFMNAH